jgi:ATP-dependent helicase HrpB
MRKRYGRLPFYQSTARFNFNTMLPILAYREQIITQLHAKKKLVLTAPPGTGKSTQVPKFFISELSPDRQMVVLEPRRIAARSLAGRVAEELGGLCGGTIGYQVRFERNVSPATRVCFQTYGTFLRQLLTDPAAAKTSIIVFDEFHERSIEADALLAWVRQLAGTVRPDLSIMALSATLDKAPLAAFLEGCGVIDIAEKAFPVDVRYQPPGPQEPLAHQVERAFNSLFPMSTQGSVLIFLPGVFEIERAAEKLHDACRRRSFRLLALHGKMGPAEQLDALRAPESGPCVILATNVAETSLTIPGVTAVVDSGLARMAAYDPERDRNTLFVSRISLQNAAQRAGRAGRLTDGVCVRLWAKADERVMPETISPEIMRLDPAKTMLSLFHCGMLLDKRNVSGGGSKSAPQSGHSTTTFKWLTPPAPERWTAALDELARCGAIDPLKTAGVQPFPPLTTLGEQMARLPVSPSVAAMLLAGKTPRERTVNIAMAAVWDAVGDERFTESQDLFDLAERMLLDTSRREFGRECHETRDQLERLVKSVGPDELDKDDPGTGPLKRAVVTSWMRTFSHRIAARVAGGPLYQLGDGRTVRLILKKPPAENTVDYPELIVALVVHERGGRSQGGRAQARQVTAPLYLPLETTVLETMFPHEVKHDVACRWDEDRQRVVVEKKVLFRGLAFGSEDVSSDRNYQPLVTACLAGKIGTRNWMLDEPRAEQFVYRMKLVAGNYPTMGIPAMDADDWNLVYHELCEGKSSLAEVKKSSFLQAIRSYIGGPSSVFIDKKAPDVIILPSGKKGHVAYFENAPPELSARLGDFIGHKERFLLMDGRVQGIFNILAPNYRTVQKTADLGSFWKNAYPAIRSELKRKYPKHPWP